MELSKVRSRIPGRGIRPLANFNDTQRYRDLTRLGIDLTTPRGAVLGTGMDSVTPGLTPSSITGQLQHLQTFLPGFVATMTQPRMIDEMIGILTVGAWEDEEVIQGMMELKGQAALYSDRANIPLANINTTYEKRTVVRFEQGFDVAILEEARASRSQVNLADGKRNAAGEALEIARNRVGMYGFNNGANRTYGFLNDPNLPGYITLPPGAKGSTKWQDKTFQEATADFRNLFRALRVQTRGRVDPKTASLTIPLAVEVIDYLTITTDQGVSVTDWLDKNYPNTRLLGVPEFDGANGGLNIGYIYVETMVDSFSTDDRGVFSQMVPAKFKAIGSMRDVKAYVEDFGNASAGVLCKRPLGVLRFTGC